MRALFLIPTALVLASCQTDAVGPTHTTPQTSVTTVVTPEGGWQITEMDLPGLGYTGTSCGGYMGGGQAYDINANGDIVGWSCKPASTGGGIPRAVMWSPPSYGVMDLGNPNEMPSIATGVNDLGRATGAVDLDPTTGIGERAFIYDAQLGLTPLGTLGGAESKGTKINNSNVLVGVSDTKTGSRAFYWNGGPPMRALATMLQANDVDEYGAIAGSAKFGGIEHAAVGWTDGTVVDYGVRGQRAVLTSGPPYVGNYFTDTTRYFASRAFIAEYPGKLVAIPTLGGQANAAFGSTAGPAVVGWSEDFDPGRSTIRDAYVWSPKTGTLRLHLSPLTASRSVAFAINTKWQIVGFRQSQSVATPVLWTVTAIP